VFQEYLCELAWLILELKCTALAVRKFDSIEKSKEVCQKLINLTIRVMKGDIEDDELCIDLIYSCHQLLIAHKSRFESFEMDGYLHRLFELLVIRSDADTDYFFELLRCKETRFLEYFLSYLNFATLNRTANNDIYTFLESLLVEIELNQKALPYSPVLLTCKLQSAIEQKNL
jgi:hypothetical protein